ncbi:MAG: type IV pilus assembly protein PilM [Halothiobacillaceae bacterium]
MQLFSKKKARLGVDISSSSVKVIQLDRHRNGYKVVAFAIEPLPVGSVQDKNIVDQEAVTEALGNAIKRAGTKVRHAVLAVPGGATVSRIISLPAILKGIELEEQVRIEADQYIPYPIDEVSLDFEVLGMTAGSDENQDVLVAATRSENVDARLAVAEMAGLTVDVVDVEAFAVENAFNEMIAPSLTEAELSMPVALVDVGANMTAVHVFTGEGLIYTREHNFGGRQLTEEISRIYDLPATEAAARQRTGDLPEDFGRRVLHPFVETAAVQLERLLGFYYSAGQGGKIGLLLLGGGTANIPGFIERVAKETGTEARLANPFAGARIGPGVSAERIANEGSALIIASGLALRSFD